MHKINKIQIKILTSMVCVNVFEFFDLFIIGFIISLIIDESSWNLNNTQISWVIISSGIGATLGYFLFGFISEKIGRLKVIKSCILMISLMNLFSCFLFSGSWLLLVCFRFFIGLGAGGINVSTVPYVQEFFSFKGKGFFSGLVSVFVPVGLSLGSMATYFFSDMLGWRGLFFLGFFPVLVLFWLRSLPESPYFMFLKGQRRVKKTDLHQKLKFFVEIFKENKLNIFLVSFGSFCFIINSAIIQSWGQVMFHDILNWNKNEISSFFILISLFNFFSRLFFSLISDSFERKNILLTCGILGALGCFITSISFY